MKKVVLLLLVSIPGITTGAAPALETPQNTSQAYIATITHAFIYAGAVAVIMALGKGIHSLIEHASTSFTAKPTEPLVWAGALPRAFEKVLDLQRHPERFKKFNMESPRGFVLYGPPGTGKTMLAQVLAQKLGVPLLKENSGNFISIYQGSGTAYLSSLLKKAHSVSHIPGKPFKCVVFIDEIDGITSRAESPNREELRVAEHLLTAITAPENKDILFIGATNMFQSIDKALIRPGRLTPVQVDLPSPANRKKLFEHFFTKHNFPVKEVSPILLAEYTEGFSCADIKLIVEEAIYRHIKHPEYLPEICVEQSITAHQRLLTANLPKKA